MEEIMRITKKLITEYVKEKLANNDHWAIHAMLKIFEYQTAGEQVTGTTRELNGVGFGGADAEILSSFVRFYNKHKYLSKKQMKILHHKIKKYHRQIIQVSDEKKLVKMVTASLMVNEQGGEG